MTIADKLVLQRQHHLKWRSFDRLEMVLMMLCGVLCFGFSLSVMFDIATRKATRITPKSLFGWDGCWLDNNNVLFRSQTAREKESSIYRVSTNGKNTKRLITKAEFPTVSAP